MVKKYLDVRVMEETNNNVCVNVKLHGGSLMWKNKKTIEVAQLTGMSVI